LLRGICGPHRFRRPYSDQSGFPSLGGMLSCRGGLPGFARGDRGVAAFGCAAVFGVRCGAVVVGEGGGSVEAVGVCEPVPGV
jgi:hypothetical protein